MDRTEIESIDSLNYYGDVIYKDTNIKKHMGYLLKTDINIFVHVMFKDSLN